MSAFLYSLSVVQMTSKYTVKSGCLEKKNLVWCSDSPQNIIVLGVMSICRKKKLKAIVKSMHYMYGHVC